MRNPGIARRIGANSSKMALIFVAALTGALWMSAPSAYACSCRAVKNWGFIGPKTGRLPANAAGVIWYATYWWNADRNRSNEDLEARFKVEIREQGKFRPLSVQVRPAEGFRRIYVVAPAGERLKPGATYRFTVDKAYKYADRYEDVHRQVLVTIDHEKLSAGTKLALDLGPVTTENITVAAGGSCKAKRRVAQVSINGRLPKGAQRWRAQLLYRTIVDGEINWYARKHMCYPVVPGRSSLERAVGHELVYAFCKRPEPGSNLGGYFGPSRPPGLPLPTGRHTLMMQAVLPGAGVVLETPVKSVNLSC